MHEGDSSDLYILLALHKLLVSSLLQLCPVSVEANCRFFAEALEKSGLCPSAALSLRTLSSLQWIFIDPRPSTGLKVTKGEHFKGSSNWPLLTLRPKGQKIPGGCVVRETMQWFRSCLDLIFYWFLWCVGQISRGTVQPIRIRQQVQWGGMCSTLHQTEGWASAGATRIELPNHLPLTPSKFFFMYTRH